MRRLFGMFSALLIFVAASMPSSGQTPVGTPAAEASSSIAHDVLAHQCALVVKRDYKALTATYAHGFTRTGPGTQNESTDQVVARYALAGRVIRTTSCDIVVHETVPTPSGIFARYVEIDHETIGRITTDIETEATADFVKAADGSWLLADIIRSGFRFTTDGTVTHQEGTVGGSSAPVGPVTPSASAPTPLPADESTAAAKIVLSVCVTGDGAGPYTSEYYVGKQRTQVRVPAAPPYSQIVFTNAADTTITRIEFAVTLAGYEVLHPIFNGSFAPGVAIKRNVQFPPEYSGKRFIVPTSCTVTSVDRVDATSWKNPAPPPIARK